MPGNTWTPMFAERDEGKAMVHDRIDRLYVANPPEASGLKPVGAYTVPVSVKPNPTIEPGELDFPSDHAAVVVDFRVRGAGER